MSKLNKGVYICSNNYSIYVEYLLVVYASSSRKPIPKTLFQLLTWIKFKGCSQQTKDFKFVEKTSKFTHLLQIKFIYFL